MDESFTAFNLYIIPIGRREGETVRPSVSGRGRGSGDTGFNRHAAKMGERLRPPLYCSTVRVAYTLTLDFTLLDLRAPHPASCTVVVHSIEAVG